MKNYKTGAVYCDECKKYLGNYNTCTDENGNEKSYYALIKLKYCNDCKGDVLRAQKRKTTHDYKQRETAKKRVLQQRIKLLQEENRLIKNENKILRIKQFGTENAEQHQALIELLKA